MKAESTATGHGVAEDIHARINRVNMLSPSAFSTYKNYTKYPSNKLLTNLHIHFSG
jgi:hypothetical protein